MSCSRAVASLHTGSSQLVVGDGWFLSVGHDVTMAGIDVGVRIAVMWEVAVASRRGRMSSVSSSLQCPSLQLQGPSNKGYSQL